MADFGGAFGIEEPAQGPAAASAEAVQVVLGVGVVQPHLFHVGHDLLEGLTVQHHLAHDLGQFVLHGRVGLHLLFLGEVLPDGVGQVQHADEGLLAEVHAGLEDGEGHVLGHGRRLPGLELLHVALDLLPLGLFESRSDARALPGGVVVAVAEKIPQGVRGLDVVQGDAHPLIPREQSPAGGHDHGNLGHAPDAADVLQGLFVRAPFGGGIRGLLGRLGLSEDDLGEAAVDALDALQGVVDAVQGLHGPVGRQPLDLHLQGLADLRELGRVLFGDGGQGVDHVVRGPLQPALMQIVHGRGVLAREGVAPPGLDVARGLLQPFLHVPSPLCGVVRRAGHGPLLPEVVPPHLRVHVADALVVFGRLIVVLPGLGFEVFGASGVGIADGAGFVAQGVGLLDLHVGHVLHGRTERRSLVHPDNPLGAELALGRGGPGIRVGRASVFVDVLDNALEFVGVRVVRMGHEVRLGVDLAGRGIQSFFLEVLLEVFLVVGVDVLDVLQSHLPAARALHVDVRVRARVELAVADARIEAGIPNGFIDQLLVEFEEPVLTGLVAGQRNPSLLGQEVDLLVVHEDEHLLGRRGRAPGHGLGGLLQPGGPGRGEGRQKEYEQKNLQATEKKLPIHEHLVTDISSPGTGPPDMG
ncbi:hypothetical protein DSECCO2_560520 [anaerobic digester metagenome]